MKPIGIRSCVVNGAVTLEDGQPTGALTGRMLGGHSRRSPPKVKAAVAA